MYPTLPMDILCTLAAIPDTVLYLPFQLFFLEYKKLKDEITKGGSSTDPSSPREFKPFRVLPTILLHVFMNPLIWAMLLGFIANFASITFPDFIENTLSLFAQSNLAACMFNMGLFLFVSLSQPFIHETLSF